MLTVSWRRCQSLMRGVVVYRNYLGSFPYHRRYVTIARRVFR